MQLHGYCRSSAAYRVRIALNVKGLAYDNLPVHLTSKGAEQHGAAYGTLNPERLVPALQDGDAVFADCCLVSQVFSARRFNVPLDAFPTLVRIDAHLTAVPTFQKAAPAPQPDAE